MNRSIPGLILLALSGVLGPWAQAQDISAHSPLQVAQTLPNSGNNNPYNSPIRRANPNSMQGTQPSAPAIRGPNTVPVPRPPTLDNGGIGNRYPQSQSVPANPPKFLPNPPVRDPATSN
ncbi:MULTISPECIES: hypothetical protein [Pseudomonas]|uniref:Lipoprotein n=1 Tax=Pseudomonas izuensis TaxID=2684212 RepID=A0ABM7RSI9_9PSED|nr:MULTISPECIES: hypothetical protein [Pseudomonas]RKS27649.1 hypothetical protein BJ917_0504 [Pseudomonas sp. WPR_5_2]BCX68406.1 hypothetical protein LAB08_R30480 [Pseudomonas izuensis]